MSPVVSLDGLAGWVAVATPIVALTIIAGTRLLAQRSRRGGILAEFDSRESVAAEQVVPTDLETAGRAEGEQAGRAHTIALTPRGTGPIGDCGSGEAGADQSDARDEREAIAVAIADAENVALKSERAAGSLAELYLALAVLERKAGDEAAAAPLLRKSVVLAQEAGHAAIHAKARLELGDQAQASGDLPTACEHWQIARALFDQLDMADLKADAAARMHENRCPTDWVLTDF